MVITREICLVLLQCFLVEMLKFEKPLPEIGPTGRCTKEKKVFNDCNWCRCDRTHRYTCDARACNEVDLFGHFNDAIREFDLGMEGHGSWRSTEEACEPGVQYRRGGLLCVCTDDGTWPNPVCRDIFRVLHSVEETKYFEVTGQECTATKLYLVGCNACFCPSTQKLDPQLCTKNKCSEDDPILKDDSQASDAETDDEAVEIYAECRPDQTYKLGCKICHCLRNNRLHCGNCTDEGNNGPDSYCRHVKPGQMFSRDCNLCYCDKDGLAYCTTKKCLSPTDDSLIFPQSISTITDEEPSDLVDEENCIPGRNYKKDCNDCFCSVQNNIKTFGCTKKSCGRASSRQVSIQEDCVKGSVYEVNCLVCHCDEINGIKTEICRSSSKCKGRQATAEDRSNDLDSLHGYCEPLHVYKKDCNTCHCLSDGKTVRCTSYVCEKKVRSEPVFVDIVPVTQSASPCPKGFSYKIDCNICFCLSNGNAICTTSDCTKKRQL